MNLGSSYITNGSQDEPNEGIETDVTTQNEKCEDMYFDIPLGYL